MFFWGGGGWGGGGDETFPNLPKVSPKISTKILAKFHELKISKKPQHYCKANTCQSCYVSSITDIMD